MERLTHKIKNMYLYDVDDINVGQKLGKLEDVLEKYNIESVEELEAQITQNQKAIEVLECVKNNLLDISSPYWQYFAKTGNAFMTYDDIELFCNECIDNQIEELRGEENEKG